MKLTLNHEIKKEKFIEKILNNLTLYSSSSITCKLNYEKSIFLIDDINLDITSSFDIFANSKKELIDDKLSYVYQLLKYKILEYPSNYNCLNSLNNKNSTKIAFSNKFFELHSTEFIFAGRSQHEKLRDVTINI